MELLVDGELRNIVPAGRYSDVMRLEGDELVLKSDKPFTYEAVIGSVNPFESVDDRPLPQPKRASNILQQMHHEFRRSMGVIREAFGDDTPWPGYEIEDDELTLFEEEIAEERKQQRDEKIRLAKEKAEKEKAENNSAENAAASAANDDKSPAPDTEKN